MSSDSAGRIRELEDCNFEDIEEVSVLKFLIKRGSADFQKPGRSKIQRDKIAAENMQKRRRLYGLINDINYRNRIIRSLKDDIFFLNA
jgi:hypothetical protein